MPGGYSPFSPGWVPMGMGGPTVGIGPVRQHFPSAEEQGMEMGMPITFTAEDPTGLSSLPKGTIIEDPTEIWANLGPHQGREGKPFTKKDFADSERYDKEQKLIQMREALAAQRHGAQGTAAAAQTNVDQMNQSPLGDIFRSIGGGLGLDMPKHSPLDTLDPAHAGISAGQYLANKLFGPADTTDKDAAATLKAQREAAGSEALSGPGDLMKKMLAGAGYGGMGTTPTGTKGTVGAGPRGVAGAGGSDNYGDIEKQARLQRYYETEAKKQEYEGVRREVQMREDMANEQAARAQSAEVAHDAAMTEAKKHLELEDQAMKKWMNVKVDPSRLWNEMDGFDRANWHAGVAIGGFLRDLRGGGENEFLQNYNNLVDRDVKAQMLQADKFKGLAEHEGNMFSQLQKMGMSKLDAASKVSEMMHQSMLDRVKGVAMSTANEADAERARKLVPALEGQILQERQKRQEAAASRAAAAADKAYNRWFELQKLGVEAGKIRAAGQGDAGKLAADIRERTVAGPAGKGITFNRKEDAIKYNERVDALNGLDQALADLEAAQGESTRPGRILGKTGLKTEATKKYEAAGKRALLKWSHAEGGGALDKGLDAAGSDLGFKGQDIDILDANPAAVRAMRESIVRRKAQLHEELGGQSVDRVIDPNTGLETQVPNDLLLGPGLGARKTPVGNVGP